MDTLLSEPGSYVWWWGDLKKLDPGATAAAMGLLDVRGIIVQVARYAPAWCKKASNVQPFIDRAIRVYPGLGFDFGGSPDGLMCVAALLSCAEARDVCKQLWETKHGQGGGVGSGGMVNWESAWDGKKTLAQYVVTEVLKRRPDAPSVFIDAPWWAPLHTRPGADGKKHWTHPSAPTAEFGRLCARDRYPQTYGANVEGSPDGASMRMLEWSRDPSQYPAIAQQAGLQPWVIRPSLQMYKRSLQDHLDMMLKETIQCLWDWLEMDEPCRLALSVISELKRRGFVGPDAARRFQRLLNLKVDGIVDPRTLAALGLKAP